MKLEVGMYVRTEKGTIAKIIKEIKDGRRKEFVLDRIVILNKRCTKIIRRTDKVTSRHNIIKLIKKKDLILATDGKIYEVSKIYIDYVFTTAKTKEGLVKTLVDYQIDRILTRERFEEMTYKVV